MVLHILEGLSMTELFILSVCVFVVIIATLYIIKRLLIKPEDRLHYFIEKTCVGYVLYVVDKTGLFSMTYFHNKNLSVRDYAGMKEGEIREIL